MPNAGMAGQAVGGVGAVLVADSNYHIAVAVETGLLSHPAIEGSDLNRFREVTGGKSNAMVPAVDPFDDIFVWPVVGGVTIVAGCDRLMTAVIDV
jgi:hypothetical protein